MTHQRRKRVMRKRTKKAPTTRDLAKKIQKIEHNQDLKWFDFQLNPTTISNAGIVISDFQLIPEGTGFSERIGSKISPTSLQIKLAIRTAENRLFGTKVRMLVFWDRQTNGAAPILVSQDNGVLDNSVIGSAPLALMYAPINYLTRDRYHVVYDKVFTINPKTFLQLTAPDVTEMTPVELFIRKNIRLGRILKYDSAGGSITDLVSNSIHVAFLSDDTAGTSEPNLEGGFRMYYKDT